MSKVLKYIFDRVLSFFGLVVLLPLLLLIAIFIIVCMPDGPVFFRQYRVGKDGRLFRMVKFRTMVVGSDNASTVTVSGDGRVTRLGSFLRRYKLDELPELWNVLIAQMSLVGPRPDVPGYADALVGEDREVLSLRPGITGPASLKYRHEEEILAQVDDPERYNDEVIFPDKVRINRYYLHHLSLATDLKIIAATVLGLNIEYDGERI